MEIDDKNEMNGDMEIGELYNPGEWYQEIDRDHEGETTDDI